jgi:trk system potassium uptake protein
MKIVIVGCGRVGSRLALRLEAQGHDIVILDEARDAFLRLGTGFQGTAIQGSGLDREVLERVLKNGADLVLALTRGDNRNIMVAQMVKHLFGIERVVARLHDPIRADKYRELGIETLCTTTVIEGLLELYATQGQFPELPGEMNPAGDDSALQ